MWTGSNGRMMLVQVHQETFGKSGCRRIVPGQYLGVDPKGRACMIGAVEKQKLVYILNRDSAARLTISSPLEAHKSHTLVYHLVGVDVGFENPLFACLELDYEVRDIARGYRKWEWFRPLSSPVCGMVFGSSYSTNCMYAKIIMISVYVRIIGRAKRAPHWGVQSRFRVIYICQYVCRMSNHVNQTRACSKSVLGGKILPVTPLLFVSTIR